MKEKNVFVWPVCFCTTAVGQLLETKIFCDGIQFPGDKNIFLAGIKSQLFSFSIFDDDTVGFYLPLFLSYLCVGVIVVFVCAHNTHLLMLLALMWTFSRKSFGSCLMKTRNSAQLLFGSVGTTRG